ncbi:MAG: dihydropteroate synthase [Bacteroidales bacterium]|nr:dihydropteroate synthase [Bacteroidales bacterium]
MHWLCREYRFTLGHRPLVMGIVNVTPDSFSDGGQFFDPDAAIAHGLQLVADGADILDVGGESTRPGSQPVPAVDELARVLPVVRELAKRTQIPISVDTTKASVARACLDAGAVIVNDITGLTGDPAMPALCAKTGAGVVIMHMQGTPQTMQVDPRYDDVTTSVRDFLSDRIAKLCDAGIPLEALTVDPGIGFGKTMPHNLQLLAHLAELRSLGRPIVLGVSRKGVIGTIINRERGDRLAGSLAVACFATATHGADIWRVHDVAAHRDAARLYEAIRDQAESRNEPKPRDSVDTKAATV